MELTHLDGRKLIIKSAPGEVIRPVTHDPFAQEQAQGWTLFEDEDCPGIADVAVAGQPRTHQPLTNPRKHVPATATRAATPHDAHGDPARRAHGDPTRRARPAPTDAAVRRTPSSLPSYGLVPASQSRWTPLSARKKLRVGS